MVSSCFPLDNPNEDREILELRGKVLVQGILNDGGSAYVITDGKFCCSGHFREYIPWNMYTKTSLQYDNFLQNIKKKNFMALSPWKRCVLCEFIICWISRICDCDAICVAWNMTYIYKSPRASILIAKFREVLKPRYSGLDCFKSLWNFTGTSTVFLPISERCDHNNSQYRGYETSGPDGTLRYYWLCYKRGPLFMFCASFCGYVMS